jgi:hypothetical protein
VVLVCELPALAQTPRFSVGAVGGVRLSSGAPEGTHDESPVYTVGAAFEVSFGDHLAAEVNALYQRFGSSSVDYISSFGLPGNPVALIFLERLRANSIDVPILGKYYFGRRNLRGRFFVATGYSFQREWITTTSAVEQVVPNSGVGVFAGSIPGTPTLVGAVFGAGVARKMGPLTVMPAFRYTHWGARSDGASRNQLEILLSPSF